MKRKETLILWNHKSCCGVITSQKRQARIIHVLVRAVLKISSIIDLVLFLIVISIDSCKFNVSLHKQFKQVL